MCFLINCRNKCKFGFWDWKYLKQENTAIAQGLNKKSELFFFCWGWKDRYRNTNSELFYCNVFLVHKQRKLYSLLSLLQPNQFQRLNLVNLLFAFKGKQSRMPLAYVKLGIVDYWYEWSIVTRRTNFSSSSAHQRYGLIYFDWYSQHKDQRAKGL